MRNIFITIIILTGSCLATAQTPIKPLNNLDLSDSSGTYYKDIDNEMTPFLGTWLYQEGSTLLKIILKKSTQYYNGRYYIDLLVGEYQYVENGIEKVNTLGQINTVQGYEHSIDGSTNFSNCQIPPVQNCRDGQLRFHLILTDPTEDRVAADFIIHKNLDRLSNEIVALITFSSEGTIELNEAMPSPAMPWQREYVLVKQ